MLPLISSSERQDLVISVDPAVKLNQAEREPVRALVKKDCDLNGTPPTIFTVRPLRSREMVRVIKASIAEASEGLIKAAERGIVSINHGGALITKPADLDQMIDDQHHSAILAVGGWIIEQSSLPEDPEEPTE